MPDVVYYVASSLDGYIATPDGGIEWLAPFEASAEDYGYAEFYASIDAVLLGSRTYEQALGFGEWPYAGKPAWVFSRRAPASPRSDVTITGEDPRAVVETLAALGVRRAWLVGGGSLAGSFESAGLITEYIVSIIPVFLGAGVPLLGGTGTLQRLRLATTRTYADGIVQLRLVPAVADGHGGPADAGKR